MVKPFIQACILGLALCSPQKGRKWCPFGKGVPFWCLWTKGTVFAAKKGQKWCRLVKGYYISAVGALFLYGKDRQNQCPFAKGHQNSAPKGTVLRTIKRCPKGTISIPCISLSIHLPVILFYTTYFGMLSLNFIIFWLYLLYRNSLIKWYHLVLSKFLPCFCISPINLKDPICWSTLWIKRTLKTFWRKHFVQMWNFTG